MTGIHHHLNVALKEVFLTRCTCMHSEPTKSVVFSQATKGSRVVERESDSFSSF